MNWPHIITALITPYDRDGRVDPGKAAEIAQYLLGQGSGGFVIAGSTGEAYALSLAEREALFRRIRSALPSDVPLWIGTGSNDTRQAVELTEAADDWGADGMLVVAPYYNKPPAQGLVQYFVDVAKCTTKPVMVYDVPGRTGVAIAPEVVAAARAQAENIAAVKEAAGTITAMIAMHRALGSGVKLYSGDDALLLPSLAVGATGVVSVASHVAADHMQALIEAYYAGRQQEAIILAELFWPLAQNLFCQSNPIPLKWLMNRLGWNVGGVRAPLMMLADDTFAALWTSYEEVAGQSMQRRA